MKPEYAHRRKSCVMNSGKEAYKKPKVVYSEEPPIRPLNDMEILCRYHLHLPPGNGKKMHRTQKYTGFKCFRTLGGRTNHCR